ncbi:MAG: response regulator transcription factor [Cyanobacteria bacterium]|nr:response regulator transcription factor [Cyanobacteriota bacterium]
MLMDLAMPEMDGIQATREIRTKHSKIGIIIFTSQTHAEDVRAALSAGVNGYCLKDVDDERLKRAVLSVADGDLWLDSRIVHAVVTHTASISTPKLEEVGAIARMAAASYGGPYESLSSRERDVLELLVKGLTNKEIGEKLYITRDTVKTHIRHIMEKLAAKDRTDAAVKAVQHKII